MLAVGTRSIRHGVRKIVRDASKMNGPMPAAIAAFVAKYSREAT
jgi:hypothetical protein